MMLNILLGAQKQNNFRFVLFYDYKLSKIYILIKIKSFKKIYQKINPF